MRKLAGEFRTRLPLEGVFLRRNLMGGVVLVLKPGFRFDESNECTFERNL